MYHNKRDKGGKFAPKKKAGKGKKKAKATSHIFDVYNLDDSGSMIPKVEATVEGFNGVLAEARKSANKNGITTTEALIKFGLPSKFTWEVGKVRELEMGNSLYNHDKKNLYTPSQGGTALWDAVAYGLEKIERALEGMPKGTKVVYTIFTDGGENASREYEEKEVRDLIKTKQDKGWVINFVGAGSKAEVTKVAQGMGIYLSNSVNYVNNSVGTAKAFATISSARSMYAEKVANNIATADGFFQEEKK